MISLEARHRQDGSMMFATLVTLVTFVMMTLAIIVMSDFDV